MKTPSNRLGRLTGILAISSFLLAPTVLKAQENEAREPEAARQPERKAPKDVPEAKRIQRMMRELNQLKAAGKTEEASQLAEKIRKTVAANPQLMERINRAMADRKPKGGGDRSEMSPQQAGSPLQAKMQHLRIAAEQLQAAGYGEYAAKAREEIGRLQAAMRREQAEAKSPGEAMPRPGRPGDMAPVMEELKKLHGELEELRGEFQRLKAEAGPRPMPGRPPEMRPMDGLR